YTAAHQRAMCMKRQLKVKTYVAGSITDPEAREFKGAQEALAPFNVNKTGSDVITVGGAVLKVVECLKLGIPLDNLDDAVKAYLGQQENVTPKLLADVIKELLASKERDDYADCYVSDLRYRLTNFAKQHQQHIHHITGPQIQHWLERLGLSTQ